MKKHKHMLDSLKFCFCTLLLVVLSFSISAQSQTATQANAPIQNAKFKKVVERALSLKVDTISVQVLRNLERPYVLLDTREEEEYNVSHLENALFLSYDDPDYSILNNVPKDTEIILYCSIGYRSEKMGKKLEKKGYTNVKNVYGSIFEWANRGYPLVDGQNNKTNVVHGYNKRWSKCVTNPDMEVTY